MLSVQTEIKENNPAKMTDLTHKKVADKNVESILVKNYINGIFVGTNELIDNVNPATGEVISKIPRSNKAEVELAVSAAKTAFSGWSKTPLLERAEWLKKLADELERRFDELTKMESMDCGKPLQMTTKVDIPRSIANLRFFANFVSGTQTDSFEMNDAINISQRHPVGVAGLITPWNLPLYLLTWKVAPALICGNTIVAKPSELTPMTANALAEAAQNISLPNGVLNIVHGYGYEAGKEIVSHKDIRLVSFTGGTATGAEVAKIAAPMFKKLSMELGGKNAGIVFGDCDFESTVKEAVRSSFLNSGQICLCCSRILVEKSIYEKFVDAYIIEVKKRTVGDPLDINTVMGTISSEVHLKKIEYYVNLAKEEGGKIACGGKRPNVNEKFSKGFWYEPTVITGLDPKTSRCATEEIFGPVVTIHPFETAEEAIEIHNTVEYGLAGAVWTNDLKRAHYVTKNMHTGMVWVNCWLKRDLRVPFGGVNQSGVGREGGKFSLEFYSHLKNICFQY